MSNKRLILVVLGAVFAASSVAMITKMIEKEVTVNVQLQMGRQIELINTAPMLRRVAIAWRVIWGNL